MHSPQDNYIIQLAQFYGGLFGDVLGQGGGSASRLDQQLVFEMEFSGRQSV